jgi:hypothetical protein
MVVNVGQGCIPAFHLKCHPSFAGVSDARRLWGRDASLPST